MANFIYELRDKCAYHALLRNGWTDDQIQRNIENQWNNGTWFVDFSTAPNNDVRIGKSAIDIVALGDGDEAASIKPIDIRDMYDYDPIPEAVLKKFNTFLVMVDGHRRRHPTALDWVTQDIYSDPLLVRYNRDEKKFYVIGDQKDEELVSKIEAWVPVEGF